MPSVQGYNGTVSVNAITLTAYRWSVDYRSDIFDVTNMEYFGGGQYLAGLVDVDVSIDCCWDTADDPFNTGLANIRPGQTADVILDFDNTNFLTVDGIQFTTALLDGFGVLIVSVRLDVSVRDVVRYSIAGKASGYRPRGVARTPIGTIQDT